MGKLVTIFLLAAMLGAIADGRVITMPGASSTEIPQPLVPLPKKLSQEGVIFWFWIHEIGTGPNKTVWNVGYSENTLTSPSSFGLIQMIDSPITSQPTLDSLSLGRVQGTMSYADLNKTALSVNWNIIFTEENFYNGSTLQVQGRIPVYENWRDQRVSIVGGTLSFSFFTGVAFSSYSSFDPSTLHRVSSLFCVVAPIFYE